ncbi:uncharacterized protein [Nicotiana tomentosiformis]|uniref:uncharacterized protein n=1 Tax=Nicotiana tomentosiformis TaxID=4098 RepID=UPI00388C90C5
MRWNHFFELVDKVGPVSNSIAIKCNPLSNGWMKPNSGGCSKGNLGPSGGGGIVRHEKREMIIAYAMPLGIVTNNTAETLALKAGIEWCIDQNVKKLEIENDSLMLVQWLTNTTNIP